MSSGGQRGIDVSGITGLRLQNASDVTARTRLQDIYANFASTTGANAWRNRTPNGYGYFLDFTQGRKEVGRRDICGGTDCSTCLGLPYQYTNVLRFRNA
jgi:hypothetical protein